MASPSGFNRIQRKIIGAMAQASLTFGHWLETTQPLITSVHLRGDDEPSKNLIVLLPGIQDHHWDFELAGFIAAAKEQKFDADLIAVDAHIGYYVRETILNRLREDVILPARESGYENIWIAGTSLGGLGSMLYAKHFGGDIQGIFMMAPFLGGAGLVQEIEKAGGPSSWQPIRSAAPGYQIGLWEWLQAYLQEPARHPRMYLGFGEGDRFARANSVLADHLPLPNVLRIPGGHDWRTWAKLWTEFLDRVKGEWPHQSGSSWTPG